MKNKLYGVEFIYNSHQFQPGKFGEQMVSNSMESHTVQGVINNQQNFKINKFVATSEESWLGLGLSGENEKEWFEIDISSPSV